MDCRNFLNELSIDKSNTNSNNRSLLDFYVSVLQRGTLNKNSNKRDDCSLPIGYSPVFDDIVPYAPSYGVYIS